MMEMSVLNSGYPDVSRGTDYAGIHTTPRVGGHSDNGNISVHASPNRLHYTDAGPHREMAVDCPANFVGVKKEPPRMPRPLSNVIQTGSPSATFKSSQTSLTSPGKSYPGSSLSISQGFGLEPVDPAGTPSRFNRDERDRSERLRRYQEELAKRREMEERINQEQEQLRNSLRGSKKMQGLEERRARARTLEVHDGFDNPNYCADDGDERMVLHKMAPAQSESKLPQQSIKDDHVVAPTSKLLVCTYYTISNFQLELNRIENLCSAISCKYISIALNALILRRQYRL